MRSWVILGAISISVAGLSGCSGGNKCKNFDCTNGDGGGSDDAGDNPFGDDSSINGGEGGTGMTCIPDPQNFDVPGNNCDDDGDGMVDNTPAACDMGLMMTGDAFAFAKSIGLCAKSNGTGWGVVTAAYTKGFNTMMPPDTNQHGILPKFGSSLKPRDGSMLGVLSSGYAREYDQCNMMNGPFKGGCAMPMNGMGMAPPGFPKPAQGCDVSMVVNDVSVVHLTIKVPANAKGFSFDFNFFSGEWPEWVCTTFNDAFIAYLKSTAFNNGQPDNISFDSKKNPVSVNNGFFDRCAPKNATVGCLGNPSTDPCAGGAGDLMGTGFYDPGSNCGQQDSGGGATGWLTTSAPVKPGETITLDFMVWDTGDAVYDSSVLLDKWQWLATDTTTGTVRPPN